MRSFVCACACASECLRGERVRKLKILLLDEILEYILCLFSHGLFDTILEYILCLFIHGLLDKILEYFFILI